MLDAIIAGGARPRRRMQGCQRNSPDFVRFGTSLDDRGAVRKLDGGLLTSRQNGSTWHCGGGSTSLDQPPPVSTISRQEVYHETPGFDRTWCHPIVEPWRAGCAGTRRGDILSPAANVVAAAAPARFASAVAAPVAQEDTNAPVAEPNAVAATHKWNNIALPLDVQNQFSTMGLTFNANGLIGFIGRSSVTEVRWWNAAAQAYQKCTTPAAPLDRLSGTNFPLATSAAYMVQLNASDPTKTVVSFVGDVPPSGSVHYSLIGATPGCRWNTISLPLDQSGITTAYELAVALGGASVVTEVREWNASANPQAFQKCQLCQGFLTCSGTNFATRIGYPYWVCLKSGKTWP